MQNTACIDFIQGLSNRHAKVVSRLARDWLAWIRSSRILLRSISIISLIVAIVTTDFAIDHVITTVGSTSLDFDKRCMENKGSLGNNL